MNSRMTKLMIIAALVAGGGLAARAAAGCGGCGGKSAGSGHDNMVLAAADEKHEHKHQHKEGGGTPARGDYPLSTCVVSGDELGSMGDVVKYAYKTTEGKERDVLFCCKDCIKKFKKDPEKYLKMIDEAAAKKAATKPDAK